MAGTLSTDICIIGGGSAGLAVAAGASQMGADVVLIEGRKMGGDCLNYGCVPSKSLLAAGKAAKLAERAARFGVGLDAPRIDFRAVHDHVAGVIATIAPHDSVERFEGLGVRVIEAMARFVAADEVEAGAVRIRAKRFVVATGSGPFVPPIPGLDEVAYLTNETVFDLVDKPDHLIVIGGGPIGCELGQAFRHLGTRVSIAEMASIMPKDDPELVDLLRVVRGIDGVVHRRVARRVGAERGVVVARDIFRVKVVGQNARNHDDEWDQQSSHSLANVLTVASPAEGKHTGGTRNQEEQRHPPGTD